MPPVRPAAPCRLRFGGARRRFRSAAIRRRLRGGVRAGRRLLDDFFALRDALAAAVGRPVDLVMDGSVRNPSSWPASSGRRNLSMDHDPRAYLWDAREGADAITSFVGGRTLDDYLADRMLRAAVERQFEIIGEALRKLQKEAPELARELPELSQATRSVTFSFTPTPQSTIERCGARSTKACRRCALAWPRCSTGQGRLNANHVNSREGAPAR